MPARRRRDEVLRQQEEARGGGTTTITGANITTNAKGANGVFSHGGNASTNATSGDGTAAVVSDSTITTTGSGSGGIMTTGQGIMKASNLTVKTSGGTLNNAYGHVFHVTNTSAAITLEGVAINNSDSENVFLSVCDDAWSGLSNAATVNATDQVIVGNVLVGSDSSATLNLSGSSTWMGATSGNITDHRSSSTVSGSIGTVNVNLGSGSTWTLAGDSCVSSIAGEGQVGYGAYALYVNGTAYTASNPYSDVGFSSGDAEITGFTDVSASR